MKEQNLLQPYSEVTKKIVDEKDLGLVNDKMAKSLVETTAVVSPEKGEIRDELIRRLEDQFVIIKG